MAIDDVAGVRAALGRALERLRQHQDVYSRNEAAVREQLVLPLLRALGWDTENPEEVHPEERGTTGFADYTLKVGGRSIVTVEVKKGDEDVAEPGALEQAHRHASAAGIKLCMATNGSQWVLARSFEEGRDLRGRIIWQAVLSEQTVDNVAQKLVFMARKNVEDIDKLTGLQDALDEHWESLLADPTDVVQSIVGLLSGRLPQDVVVPYPSFIEDWVDQRIREVLQPIEATPSGREERGTTGPPLELPPIPRRSAASILLEAAERAISEHRLSSDAKIETGHSRYLVSPQPVHKHSRPFFSPRRVSNGLYIETHCSIRVANDHAGMLNRWNPRRGGRRSGK